MPPPRTAKTVKCSIAKAEDIEDRERNSLFLTRYSQSPMDDGEKVIILNSPGPGSTPEEPLALVAKMSDSERSAFERVGRANAALSNATPSEIQYGTSIQRSPTFLFLTYRLLMEVYYLLYADGIEKPSKVAIDPEQPSLGRIRVGSVPPPQSPSSITRCISRVERMPALVNADLFADITSDAPLKEGQITIFRTDGPGLSPNKPLVIVQAPVKKQVPVKKKVPVKNPSIPEGRYVIKSRAADIYWIAWSITIEKIYFWHSSMKIAKGSNDMQVIEHSPIVLVFRG